MIKCLSSVPFFLFLLHSNNTSAQSTPVISGKPISATGSENLQSIISAYHVYELKASELKAYLQADSTIEKKFTLELPGLGVWPITLTLRPLLSDAYRLRVDDGQQILELPGPGDITWVGHLSNDPAHEVSLTVDNHFIFGTIQTPEGDYFIEPLSNLISGALPDKFIIYKTTDVMPNSGKTCGVTEVSEKKLDPDVQALERQVGLCKHAELAIASDFGMFTRYTNAAGVQTHNIGVMNEVSTDYDNSFDDEIYFLIVTQYVSSTSTSSLDVALTSTTNAETLLSNFRTWGNNASNFGVTFDLGQLWVTRNIQTPSQGNGVIGIAYLGKVCRDSSYHLLEDFNGPNPNGSGWELRVLTSHEIGHNFNCSHDAGSTTIMAPNVNNTTTWSSQSVSQVNNFLPSLSCVFTCDVNFSASSYLTSEYIASTYLPSGAPSCGMSYTDLMIPVQYSSSSTNGGTVTVSVTGGTATENLDFSLPGITITFPAGSYSQTVNLIVRIWNDAIFESSETIDLELMGGLIGSQNTTTITIVSDDLDPATNPYGQIGMADAGGLNVPFRGANQDCRTQFIISALELTSAGFNANDIINGLALEVTTKSSTQPYNGFTIKMKHTTAAPASTGPMETSGFTTVYSANYTTSIAWNKFNFTQGFIWNGTSNLRIEFCFDNASSSAHDLVRTSNGAASVYVAANSGSGCTLPTNSWFFFPNNRPNTRLYKVNDIAVTLADNADTNLKAGQTAYFKDAQNEFVLTVEHTSGPDPGCVNVEIERAGIGRQSAAWLPGYFISDKTFLITTDNPASTFGLTLYYGENEVAVWGADVSNLNIITSSSPISTANASNSAINENVIYSVFGPASNSDLYRSYKSTFTGLVGGFALTDAPQSALPVRWLDFAGKLVKKDVFLNWMTAAERDNIGFDVERSTDGSFFEKIGFVKGFGTISKPQPYYFIDTKAFQTNAPVLYYRLKQIDNDGVFSYSKIVSVPLSSNEPIWHILPNPAHSEALLQRNDGSDCLAVVSFTDVSGREVLHQQVTDTQTLLDLNPLPVGVYLVTVQSDDSGLWQFKLVRI